MAQYIDKSALVAMIKKLNGKVNDGSSYCNGWQHALRMLEMELDTLEVKEMEDGSLEKFKSLQHISRDLKSTLQDWGYAPNLYYFDGNWHVDWISCEGGDSIKDFTGDTVEEAINKACNWFHSTFCNS